MIRIERVRLYDLQRYNTCNYPKDAVTPAIQSLSYTDELRKTYLHNYVSEFNALYLDNPWLSLSLSPRTLAIIKKYNAKCWKSGMLLDSDELWSCVPELAGSGMFIGTRWFFRFSKSSPKDGVPSFPVLSEYDVLKKIATSGRASLALEEGDTLYFRRFDDEMDIQNEFRVFVHCGAITAISTYVSFTDFSMLDDRELQDIARKICDFHGSLSFNLPASYTMDVHVSDAGRIQLIEFNSFGYWLAAGSCLFDWLDDYDILYGDGSAVVFRLAELE